jgi:hypothetical protein
MKRIEDRGLTPEELAAFAGQYYSEDLDVSYQVERVGDRLFIRTPVVEPVYRADWGITGYDPLVYDGGGTFALGVMPVPCRMPVSFKRDGHGRPTALTIDAGRVRTLTFVKK